jgi:hypothetical protein
MKIIFQRFGWSVAVAVAVMASASSARAIVSIDLVNGNTGTANGAIYNYASGQPTGSALNTFLRIQKTGTEQGYNTSAGTPWDVIAPPTHDIQLKDLTSVDIGGTTYFEFLLNINETTKGTEELLSLNNIQIFTKATADTLGASSLAGLGTLRFNNDQVGGLGAANDVTVELSNDRNAVSGTGDMLMYVPTSLFASATADDYVYFYSKFGTPNGANGGYEDWSVILPPVPVPEATSVVSGLFLLGILGWRERGRIQQTFRAAIA